MQGFIHKIKRSEKQSAHLFIYIVCSVVVFRRFFQRWKFNLKDMSDVLANERKKYREEMLAGGEPV